MDTESKINQDIRAITQALGIDESQIEVLRPDWLAYMRQGVIVSLHLSRWRSMTTLTPEHLGLVFENEDEQKAFEKTMKLGQVYLLPDRYIKALNNLDSKARKAINKFAYTTHWGQFLTPQAFFEWREENEKYQAEYLTLRDEIYNNWSDVLFEVSDAHMANARAAYRRELESVRATGRPSSVVEAYSEGEFVTRFVDAILGAIPSPGEVYDSFSYKAEFNYIPLPSLMAEDEAKAQIEHDKVKLERDKNALELAMKREVMANYRANLNELVVDHMRGLVEQLNNVLYQAASDVLATTQGKEYLHPRSVVQLKQAIDRVKALNFFDYDDIERMTRQAEAILDTPAESRSVAEVEAKLKDIAMVTRATILTLGDRPTRAARESVEGEVITTQAVRQARQRLGLAEVEAAPATRQARIDKAE